MEPIILKNRRDVTTGLIGPHVTVVYAQQSRQEEKRKRIVKIEGLWRKE
jgi:hypothetical protein